MDFNDVLDIYDKAKEKIDKLELDIVAKEDELEKLYSEKERIEKSMKTIEPIAELFKIADEVEFNESIDDVIDLAKTTTDNALESKKAGVLVDK
jgi:hypothetical protein